tara:strand:- start:1208 stop:1702 length:495 start_codon:yes stop_codon:yes gene_type:complete
MGDAMVLDTSALISWPLSELGGSMIVNSQISELERFSPTRAQIIQSIGLIISEPSRDSISQVSKLALETGDMSGISQTDLSLVALAYSKGAVLVTDDYRMQNLAERLGMEWRAVVMKGISEIWEWELRCVGCGAVFDSLEKPSQKKRDMGECINCGSSLKLRKK